MKAVWTALAIAAALLLQSALTQVVPAHARFLDPFLLVLVYCSLTGGETHGMLAGAAAGWVQDIHFAGSVVGLSGLVKLIIGFGLGLAGTRFLLLGPGPRFAAVFLATLADAALFSLFAASLDIRATELSTAGLLARATVNAGIGALLYEGLDRRIRKEARS